jgi:hypothetical protein
MSMPHHHQHHQPQQQQQQQHQAQQLQPQQQQQPQAPPDLTAFEPSPPLKAGRRPLLPSQPGARLFGPYATRPQIMCC